MGHRQWLLRGVLATALCACALTAVGCSRPTTVPGQQPSSGQPPGGSGGSYVQPTAGPKEGEPGYPPPNPLAVSTDDPYPGKTETAAAANGPTAAVTTTPTAAATAKP